MIDFIGLFVLVVLLVLFGWLFLRSLRSKRAILKWVGLVLTGLLTLIFALVLVVVVRGTLTLNANYNADHPVAAIKVQGTPDQVAQGKQLTKICGCHGDTLAGANFFDPAMGAPPVGTLYAPNLTSAGDLKNWSDGEIIRAFREGVHKNGRSLIVMPAYVFKNVSDEDAQAIVAYLRAAPPVTPDTPTNNLNLLGAIFINIAPLQTVQPHSTQPVTRAPVGPTAEYGKYVASISCIACHGTNLAGGIPGGAPVGPNLTKIVPGWTEAQFVNLIRTGTLPDGKPVGAEMPWKEVSAFTTDDDVKALYAYIHGLPAAPDNPTK